MEQFIYSTYTIVLPIIVTALMGYVVWLLKNQKKDRDANSKGTMLLLRVQLIEYHDKYMRLGDIAMEISFILNFRLAGDRSKITCHF